MVPTLANFRVPSLDGFIETLLPAILSAADPARAMDSTRLITCNDRWNCFEGWHQTTRYLQEQYAVCGAETEIHVVPTGGMRGTGKWIIPQAADVVSATIDLIEPTPRRMLDFKKCPWHVAQWSAATPPDGITCELVVIDREEDLVGSGHLAGKLVLTRLDPWTNRAKFCKYGVAGILCDKPVPGCPDAVAWTKFGWGALDLWEGAAPLVGFAISASDGDSLRALKKQGARLVVQARLDARTYAGTHDVVSGIIRGSEDPDAEIWAVAHSCEPGALDNASGGAASLEIARTLNELIGSGRIPRPRRTIRLLHAYECYGFFHYLEHHFRLQPPLAGVCIDTIGARPDVCGGELSWHAGAPASASVFDEIGFALLQATLAVRPVYQLARKPFISTEDTLLGDPKYGFPCPWITNHPCRGYHSSADTIDMVDAQGLAVCSAAMAGYLYYLANATTAEAMELAEASTRQTIAVIGGIGAGGSRAARESARQQHRATIDRLSRFTLTGDHSTLTERFQSHIDSISETCKGQERGVSNDVAWAAPCLDSVEDTAGTPVPRIKSPQSHDPAVIAHDQARALRIPLRRLPLAPTPENVWPHIKMQLDSSLPKWIVYWADGGRSIAEIAALASLDAGHQLPASQVIDYFAALQSLGYVDLYEPEEFLTEERLAADFSALGVRPGMDLIVHSSMKAIGPVRGGALTVINALLAAIGPGGTLLAPTFNHHHARIFNPLVTPTIDGAIPEAMWRRADARRSIHPSHSVAAIGPRAEEYLRDHLTVGVWSDQSPIGRLIQTGGHILSIGVGHDRSTAYHLAEIAMEVPCLNMFGSIDQIAHPSGQIETVRGLAWRNGECPVDPAGIDAMLEDKQLHGKVGRARATLALAADIFAARREQLGERCKTCSIQPERRNLSS